MSARFLQLSIFLAALVALDISAKQNQDGRKVPELKWDFSKSNDISLVEWPPDMMNKDGIASLAGPVKISVNFGNGKTISATVDAVYAEKRGKRIWWISLIYPKASLEDAVKGARHVVSQLDYESASLDEWIKRAEMDLALNFEEIFRKKENSLTIRILHSSDKARPWWVKATIYLE
jgi:hypothetical protein